MTVPFSQTSRTITADQRLTDYDVRVFSAVGSYRNSQTGFAWPARTTIAQIVGSHVGSVSRSMGRLADCGYISIEPRPGRTNMIAIPSPYDINPAPTSPNPTPNPKPTPAPAPGPSTPSAATVTLNPGVTTTLNPGVAQRNKSEKKNPTPPTSPKAGRQEEGEGVFRNPNSEPIQVTPIPINPEPIPVYQVEEQEIEYLTLDSLPAEIRALETPAQINPLVMLPILIALIGIAPDLAQALLDELGGRMSCQTLKAIDSPISYFRFLLKEAKAGRFVPKYGADLGGVNK